MPFTCFFLSACHISDSLLIVSLWLSKVNHFLPFCQRKTIPVFFAELSFFFIHIIFVITHHLQKCESQLRLR